MLFTQHFLYKKRRRSRIRTKKRQNKISDVMKTMERKYKIIVKVSYIFFFNWSLNPKICWNLGVTCSDQTLYIIRSIAYILKRYRSYYRHKICFRKVAFVKVVPHCMIHILSFIRYGKKNCHWHVRCMKLGHQIWRIPLTTTTFRVGYIT